MRRCSPWRTWKSSTTTSCSSSRGEPDGARGAIVTLLGANGAGKTTTLRAVTGLLGLHRGEITKGRVELDGRRIDHLDAPRSSGPASARSWRAAGCSPS